MYYNYCVNKQPQDDGYHEVHNLDACNNLPDAENRDPVGPFASCEPAIEAAKLKGYSKVDGCKHCSEDCHTR